MLGKTKIDLRVLEALLRSDKALSQDLSIQLILDAKKVFPKRLGLVANALVDC